MPMSLPIVYGCNCELHMNIANVQQTKLKVCPILNSLQRKFLLKNKRSVRSRHDDCVIK